jgi:glycosyltransferase involved in cell wall biosynthesis
LRGRTKVVGSKLSRRSHANEERVNGDLEEFPSPTALDSSEQNLLKTQRRRLGIYCPGNGTDGPWRYVHSILAGINPDEFDVTVFCHLPGVYEPHPWVKVVQLDDHTALVLRGGNTIVKQSGPSQTPVLTRLTPAAVRLWAGFGKEVRRIARLFRQHPVDLLHTQRTGCQEAPVAAKMAGARTVLGTFHVDSTYDLHRERSGPTHRLLEIVSNRCLDTAIAVSHATKRDWVRRSHIPASRVVTIHNGINPEKFCRLQSREAARRALGLPENALVVGGLGRLEEAKGFTHLIDAAARLRPEFPNLTVAIAGAGPLREALEHQTAQLGLSNVVRFLGFQSNVQPVLDALDVFAMPSLCETLGYALLEAMATELPAVGAAVGGIPEVIFPGETGFVVPPQNADRLAEGLRALLRDANLRARLGVAARARVIRDFHERDMVSQTLSIYRNTFCTMSNNGRP